MIIRGERSWRRVRCCRWRRRRSRPSASGRAIGPPSGSPSRPTRSSSSCPRRTARSASSSARRIVRNLNEAQLAAIAPARSRRSRGALGWRRRPSGPAAGAARGDLGRCRRPPVAPPPDDATTRPPHGGRTGAAVTRLLRAHRPQLAPQARSDRPRDPPVRRPRAVRRTPRRARTDPDRAAQPADRRVPPQAIPPVDRGPLLRAVRRPGRSARRSTPTSTSPTSSRDRPDVRARSAWRRRRADPRSSSFTPTGVTVELDPFDHEDGPGRGRPRRGAADGLEVGDADCRATTVDVSGPDVGRSTTVVAARARRLSSHPGSTSTRSRPSSRSTPSASAVSPVDVDPPTVRVTIPVGQRRAIEEPAGQPGRHRRRRRAGFEVASVTVEPHVVTVAGRRRRAGRPRQRRHRPGLGRRARRATSTATVDLALPTGVVALEADRVRVTVDVPAGDRDPQLRGRLPAVGRRAPDLRYSLDVDRVAVVPSAGRWPTSIALDGVDPRRGRSTSRPRPGHVGRARSRSTCPPA